MRKLLTAIKSYVLSVPPLVATATALFTTILVWLNYGHGLEPAMMELPVVLRIAAWYALFALAFWTPFVWYRLAGALPLQPGTPFRFLLLVAPAVFALKLALPLPGLGADPYWKTVCYYPYKLLLVAGLLYLTWRRFHRDEPFYGTSNSGQRLRPYLLMLAAMLPLIALASFQRDFLSVYPKWQHIGAVRRSGDWGHFLYELSYGTDFITVELFFRGFLVLAFARYVGAAALLPMAAFYCTIHFGKPLGECISSFFGGILLGVVTLNTRSIWGGLLVHLGIAWLMELGGSIGHQLRPDLWGH
ncbi:CPBP family intramembrane glutamic endopeptidase [Flaviaesturariibacter terrae]